MEVADDGHRDAEAVEAIHNVGHGSRGGVVVDGDADQFRTGTGQGCTLADGAVDIGGIGVGHGLHHNWCIAADANPADQSCVSFSALNLSHTGLLKSLTRQLRALGAPACPP